MKSNGFHASTSGGKKAVAISFVVVLILALAAVSVIGAFAAPPTPTSPTTNDSSSGVTASQMRELATDQAWFNSLRLQPGNFVKSSDPTKAQQWLAQYAFALRQAGAVIRSGTTVNNQSNNNSQSNSSNQSNGQVNSQSLQSGQQGLGQWLHELRGLRDKLESIGVKGNTSFNNNIAGAGVPVTGGSSSSSSAATPTTAPTTSSSSSSAATPTATPSTGSSSSSSSAATPTPSTGSSSSSSSSSSSNAGIPNTGGQTFNVNNSALAKEWGAQFGELQFAQTWYNNFRTNPAKIMNATDQTKMQHWLDQYAFALKQAGAIIRGGANANGQANNTNGQNNNSGSRVNNNSNNNNLGFGTPQQQLAQWLHMMRGLREKLSGLSNNTGAETGSMGTP